MKQSKKELILWASALAILQILDGLLTFWGVSNFGPNVEGNPLVKSLIEKFGADAALLSIKLFGIFLSFLFVKLEAHKVLIFLTGLYGGVVLIWLRFWVSITFGG